MPGSTAAYGVHEVVPYLRVVCSTSPLPFLRWVEPWFHSDFLAYPGPEGKVLSREFVLTETPVW